MSRARNAGSVSAALLLAGTPVLAQQPAAGTPSSESALEEVVVTAQKREERAQDVPISLSVLGGAELDRSSLLSVNDALSLTPGVVANVSSQGGQTRLTVRGVTAAAPLFAGSSPIAYYLDAVPFGLVRSAIAPDSNAYDLDRVEVLRGPQGTLYGASALNGVVRVLTKDPDLTQFDVKGRAGFSSTTGGGSNWRADAALNAPLIDGKLGARLVLGKADDSGWIDSPVDKDINDSNTTNFRLKIAAQPTDALSIKLSATRQENDLGAPPTGDDDFTASTQDQSINTRFNAYDLHVDYDASAFSIVSSTAYFTYVNDGSLDLAPGSGIPVLTTRLDSKVFSEEINLNSKSTGPWRWSAGAFYRDAKDSFYQTLGNLIPAPVSEEDTSKSYAVFGEVGRMFADERLELAVGARYFHDEVGMQQLILFGQPPGTPLLNQKSSFNATTPRVVLSWFANPELTVYASYSEGFRSGYPQSELVQIVDPTFPPVKPDKLKNIELGSKGSALDGRIAFDAAVYYMKWNDIQQTLGIAIPNSNAFIVANVNGESASGLGVDFAATARPVQGLTLGVNVGWNDLTQDAAVYSSGQLLFPEGSRIDASPEWTAGASAQYTFEFGSAGWTGTFDLSGRYTSTQTTTSVSSRSGLPPDVVSSDNVTTGRVSFSVAAPTNWRAMIYCDNFTNSRDVPLAAQTPYTSVSLRPRTAGLQFDYSFR